MRINGKLVKINYLNPMENESVAEIELPPVDVSKVKVGDEVLVKFTVCDKHSDKLNLIHSDLAYSFDLKNDIVSHLPQPEPEKAELPEKWTEAEVNAVCFSNSERMVWKKLNQIINYLQQLGKEKNE